MFDQPSLAAARGTMRVGQTIDLFRAFGPEDTVVPLERGKIGVARTPEAFRTASVVIGIFAD